MQKRVLCAYKTKRDPRPYYYVVSTQFYQLTMYSYYVQCTSIRYLSNYFCAKDVSVVQQCNSSTVYTLQSRVVCCGPSSFFCGRATQIEGRGPPLQSWRPQLSSTPAKMLFPPIDSPTYNFYRGGEHKVHKTWSWTKKILFRNFISISFMKRQFFRRIGVLILYKVQFYYFLK